MKKQCVQDFYSAVDQGQWDKFKEVFTEDVIVERPGVVLLKGRQALQNFYANERPFVRSVHRLEQFIEQGDSAVATATLEAENVDGDNLFIRFADVLEFEGEKIKKRTTYIHALP